MKSLNCLVLFAIFSSTAAFADTVHADSADLTQKGQEICSEDLSSCYPISAMEIALTCTRVEKVCAEWVQRCDSTGGDGFGGLPGICHEVCVQYKNTLVKKDVTALIQFKLNTLPEGQRTYHLDCGDAKQSKLFLTTDDQRIKIQRKFFFPSRRFKVSGN